jgi:hypothetical protein
MQYHTAFALWLKEKARRGEPGTGRNSAWQTKPEQLRLNLVKESERDPAQEARDQQRRERLLQADEDCGSGTSHQGSEADQKQCEKRRLVGHVARSAPWI